MFGLIAVCCNIPLPSAGYLTACAFLTAEFAASLEWQLYSYTRHTLGLPEGGWRTAALSLVFLFVVYAGVFELMRRLVGRREDPPSALVFRAGELWPPVDISTACFLMSNLSFVYSNTPFSSSALESVYNIRTLIDLAGVAMLYAYHVQRCELYMQRELDAIQNVLRNQYVQYKQSRESIDVVNRKYHGTPSGGWTFWIAWRRRSAPTRPRTRRATRCWIPSSPARACTVPATGWS